MLMKNYWASLNRFTFTAKMRSSPSSSTTMMKIPRKSHQRMPLRTQLAIDILVFSRYFGLFNFSSELPQISNTVLPLKSFVRLLELFYFELALIYSGISQSMMRPYPNTCPRYFSLRSMMSLGLGSSMSGRGHRN
jgi:hypothetical protein